MSDFSVRFLTRKGCHLCDDALGMLRQEAHRLRVSVVEVDIDLDITLREVYDSRVPVVLGPDGQILAEGRMERKLLRQALLGV